MHRWRRRRVPAPRYTRVVLGMLVIAAVAGCDVVSSLRSSDDNLTVRWSYSTSSLYPRAHPIGEITAIADGEKLVGLDTATGKERWRLDRRVRDVTVARGLIIAGCCLDDARGAPTSLIAIDARDGSTSWTVERSNEGRQLPQTFEQATIAGDTVFVSSNGGEVFAVDVSTGSELWSRPADVSGRPVVSGPTVAVGGRGKVLGFAAATGDVRWSLPLDPALRVTGAAVVEQTIVFAASKEFSAESDVTARVIAVDPASGEVTWSYVSDATESTPPSLWAILWSSEWTVRSTESTVVCWRLMAAINRCGAVISTDR